MSLDELHAAEAAVATSRRARQRAEALADEIAAEQRVCQTLRSRLRDERADVDALEDTSITSVIARLRGRRDELLDRERAEVAAVELELATHEAAVRRLTPEFERARDLAIELSSAEARRDAALERRAAQLAADPARAGTLRELDRQVAAEQDVFDRFGGALGAAHGAHGAIDAALHSMRGAQTTSTLDSFLDGGALVSALKYDQLDSSVERLAAVHASLLTLRPLLDGLTDGVEQPTLALPSTRLETFDVWFDNIVSDLMAHGRIVATVDQLERSRQRVDELIRELTEYERIARGRLDDVRARREALLRAGDGTA